MAGLIAKGKRYCTHQSTKPVFETVCHHRTSSHIVAHSTSAERANMSASRSFPATIAAAVAICLAAMARIVHRRIAKGEHLRPIMTIWRTFAVSVAHSEQLHRRVQHVLAVPIRLLPLLQHSLCRGASRSDVLCIGIDTLGTRSRPGTPPIRGCVGEVALVRHVLRMKLRGFPQAALELQRYRIR